MLDWGAYSDRRGDIREMYEGKYILILNAIMELTKVIMIIISDSFVLKFIAKALST